MKIILDTNFLLAVGQFGVDIFSELERICDFPYEVCVLSQTMEEIDKIIETPGKKGKSAARLALGLVKGRVKLLKAEGSFVDDILVRLADKDTIIATQDKELKKRIKTRIITIKQKKYLAFEHV
ncbi:MAG: DNA-binding protein [Nanoarchaeota archaeon]|nr:DNA-binding protein [Nanoarchaeota archaeon]